MWGKIEYIDLYISIRFKGKQIFYCNKMDILLKSNKLSPRQVERIKKCMYQAFYLLQTIYNDEEKYSEVFFYQNFLVYLEYFQLFYMIHYLYLIRNKRTIFQQDLEIFRTLT